MTLSPALSLYRASTSLLGPLAGLWLRSRARDGKEDSARLGERFGRYQQKRPPGQLLWLHAASVGESGVALALIEALAAREPDLRFLISTGTRTSAELIARRAPPRTLHVYAPLDRTPCVRAFLDHWRPDAGAFVESELWPNLILEAQARGVRLALVNARMSPNSLRRWRAWRAAARRLFSAFAFVSAADARTHAALTEIAPNPVLALANLKLAAPAPHVDQQVRSALAAEIGGRPFWVAASTHQGEDEIVLAAHQNIRAQHPDALLILVPRHPERGAAIAALAQAAPRRALKQSIGDAPVYIADTLGELGALYALAPVALVAGSLLPHLKGHNPVEPAKLDAAILTGPHVESFEDLFAALLAAGGALRVNDDQDIAACVLRLWRDDAAPQQQIEAARRTVSEGAEAFDRTLAGLAALLPKQTQAHANAPA